MDQSFALEFSDLEIVNYLWPQFVEHLGFEKSKQALDQALDLQRMTGNQGTLPALLFETCGVALVHNDYLYSVTGILCSRPETILLLSIKKNCAQLIGQE